LLEKEKRWHAEEAWPKNRERERERAMSEIKIISVKG